MCNPTDVEGPAGVEGPQIGGADVALGVIGAIGSFASTKMARKQAKYAAALAEMKAHDARARGGSAAAKRLGKGYRQSSDIRASTAARGLDVGEGTAARLEGDAKLLARIDANTLRDNAEKEAYGHESMAQQYRYQAKQLDPFLAATGTLIGQAGKVNDRWLARKAAGVE